MSSGEAADAAPAPQWLDRAFAPDRLTGVPGLSRSALILPRVAQTPDGQGLSSHAETM
jgi:hypothetical protein